jgi:hypothetical protein
MDGTVKTGIYKQDWNPTNTFVHPFPTDVVGMHFNAVQFQNKVFDRLTLNPRVKVTERAFDGSEELDADHILVCTGSPSKDSGFVEHDEIPVNAAYVTQCYWDYPRFNYTLTIARPWGWVFGIPLRNRCSIGYLYDAKLTSLNTIKEDVLEVFDQFGLTPSDNTNALSFMNYSRKRNFTDRVAYNGNASYFLEPLEATSTTMADYVSRYAFDVWHENGAVAAANGLYESDIENTKAMICLHYLAGSSFKTAFWENAAQKAEIFLKAIFSERDHLFRDNALKAMKGDFTNPCDVGTWPRASYEFNIRNLGIADKLRYFSEKQ